MTIFAIATVLLGTLALLVDLGNRLFGSYARTAKGAVARISLLVALTMLLGSPLLWLGIDSTSSAGHILLYLSAAVSGIIVIHFLFPYRWGIRRIESPPQFKRRSLAKGIVLCEATLALAGLPEKADGVSFLVLSDLHCNSQKKLDRIAEAIGQLRQTAVDFVFLLGDFGEDKRLLPDVIATVSQLTSRRGTFCVLGNHDCESGREATLADLFRQHSMTLLRDEWRHVEELGISLLGLAYPWTGDGLPEEAADGFTLCLTHSPDNILYFDRWKVALGLAGHTHGGKLRVGGFGAVLNPTRVGRFLDKGWFTRGDSLLIVTPGIGYFPGQLGADGEIFRLNLRTSNANNAQ